MLCAAPASVAGEDLYVVGQLGASSLPCDPATANYDPYNRHQHARHQHRAAVAKQEQDQGGGRTSGGAGGGGLRAGGAGHGGAGALHTQAAEAGQVLAIV